MTDQFRTVWTGLSCEEENVKTLQTFWTTQMDSIHTTLLHTSRYWNTFTIKWWRFEEKLTFLAPDINTNPAPGCNTLEIQKNESYRPRHHRKESFQARSAELEKSLWCRRSGEGRLDKTKRKSIHGSTPVRRNQVNVISSLVPDLPPASHSDTVMWPDNWGQQE